MSAWAWYLRTVDPRVERTEGGKVGRLDGKVAIITGAGRGIGRATALRFAREGAAVVVNDVDKEPAEETAAEILSWGGRAVVSLDNTVDLEAARRLVQLAVDAFGKLDILINNAGITRDRTFHNMTDELWDFVLDVNLKTAFHTTLAAMPYMREVAKRELQEKGAVSYHRKIHFTSSVAALMGNPGQANYSAAKGALIALTKTLAKELAPFRINVNCVAPGFIETRLTAEKEEGGEIGIPKPIRDMAIATIPIGRTGKPEDVANAHLFLASEEADFITGHVLVVSGGQWM